MKSSRQRVLYRVSLVIAGIGVVLASIGLFSLRPIERLPSGKLRVARGEPFADSDTLEILVGHLGFLTGGRILIECEGLEGERPGDEAWLHMELEHWDDGETYAREPIRGGAVEFPFREELVVSVREILQEGGVPPYQVVVSGRTYAKGASRGEKAIRLWRARSLLRSALFASTGGEWGYRIEQHEEPVEVDPGQSTAVSGIVFNAAADGGEKHGSFIDAAAKRAEVAVVLRVQLMWLRQFIEEQLAGLRNEDHLLRVDAATNLGSLEERGKVVVPALLEALGDESPVVRESAVKALGKIGGAEAEEGLYGAIQDRDDQVREVAVEVLKRFPSGEE